MGCGASSAKGAALSPSPGEPGLGSGKQTSPPGTSKKDPAATIEDKPTQADGSASAVSANGASSTAVHSGAPPPSTPPVAESASPAQSGQAVAALLSLVGAVPGSGGGASDAADEPPPRAPSQQATPAPAPLAKRPSGSGSTPPPPQSQSSVGKLPPLMTKPSKSSLPPIGGSRGSSTGSVPPQLPAVSSANDASTRPALLVPRLGPGPIACLAAPARSRSQSGGGQPSAAALEAQVAQLSSRAGPDAQCAAAARIREALCSRNPPVQALLDAGVAAPLVRLVKEGPAAARVDAAWAMVNIAASSEYAHAEALCNETAAEVLVEVLGGGKQRQSNAGGGSSSGAASTSGSDSALAELSLWALGNIAGAMHPGMRTQALAVDVLDAGALRAVLTVMEREAAGASTSAPVASPLLRVATWCLHNLAKHKREKEMVDSIPVVTKLLVEAADTEVLTCAAWVLAFLGSNEDNKSHIKQALSALPRLVQWVREASSSLATPSLLSVGTMCTGYMRALDYSEQVVEAGGVPAMLSYLQRASAGGLAAARRAMVKEALFALSNVAGGNCATVRAMLDAGVFPAVIDLLRQASGDDEILNECLYVLTNPWDPLVGADVPTSQALVASGILEELHGLLDPAAPGDRLSLLLKGLGDGLKRGQQLMTYEANMRLVDHGPEAAAAMPAVQNPVVTLYVKLGTVQRIEALNSHTDEEVHTRANGIITVLRFFME